MRGPTGRTASSATRPSTPPRPRSGVRGRRCTCTIRTVPPSSSRSEPTTSDSSASSDTPPIAPTPTTGTPCGAATSGWASRRRWPARSAGSRPAWRAGAGTRTSRGATTSTTSAPTRPPSATGYSSWASRSCWPTHERPCGGPTSSSGSTRAQPRRRSSCEPTRRADPGASSWRCAPSTGRGRSSWPRNRFRPASRRGCSASRTARRPGRGDWPARCCP